LNERSDKGAPLDEDVANKEGHSERGDGHVGSGSRQQLSHGGRKARNGDFVCSKPESELAGLGNILLCRDEDGRAKEERSENVALQRIVSDARAHRKAVALANAKGFGHPRVVVSQWSVATHHTLWDTLRGEKSVVAKGKMNK